MDDRQTHGRRNPDTSDVGMESGEEDDDDDNGEGEGSKQQDGGHAAGAGDGGGNSSDDADENDVERLMEKGVEEMPTPGSTTDLFGPSGPDASTTDAMQGVS